MHYAIYLLGVSIHTFDGPTRRCLDLVEIFMVQSMVINDFLCVVLLIKIWRMTKGSTRLHLEEEKPVLPKECADCLLVQTLYKKPSTIEIAWCIEITANT
ncbi:hypothetical protein ACJX0J_033937, partial [Zea mays]